LTDPDRSASRERTPSQRFLSAHDPINNLFHLRRDHVTATEYRAARAQAFATWAEVTGAKAAA
jgi:putative transposase